MSDMTTTPDTTPAALADRYVAAAKAAVEASLEVEDFDFDHPLRREIAFALDAAQVYSRIAVAEAIERSFPALVAEPVEGKHRAEYTREDALPGDPRAYGLETTARG